jgi:hypothetical protein
MSEKVQTHETSSVTWTGNFSFLFQEELDQGARSISRCKQSGPHCSVTCVNRTFSSNINICYTCNYDPLVCVLVETYSYDRHTISKIAPLHSVGLILSSIPHFSFCLSSSVARIFIKMFLQKSALQIRIGIINSTILRGCSLHIQDIALDFRLEGKTWF